jgi:hypothetical protein
MAFYTVLYVHVQYNTLDMHNIYDTNYIVFCIIAISQNTCVILNTFFGGGAKKTVVRTMTTSIAVAVNF